MDPQTFAQLNANAENNYTTTAQQKTAAAPHPKTPTGLKGFLINALPSIAGGAGLIGGELLDPFGGGLVSGAAASGAGEALKEKLLGQKISPTQIAIQGGETAALGSVGKLLGGAKSASKGLLATKEAPVASEAAATTAAPSAVESAKPSLGQKVTNGLVNKGQQLEAKLGSFAPGQKVGGQQLNTAASGKIGQTLMDEGIGGLSAPERLAQVGDKLGQYNDTRSSLMESHNAPLQTADKVAIQDAFRTRLAAEAGGTAPNVQKFGQQYLGEVLNKPDVASLGKYKTSLDNNAINWSANPASVEPGRTIAAKAMRGTIKDYTENKVPGLAEVNQKSSGLMNAQGALMNASGRLANLSTGSEGLWGRLLSGETAEKGKAIAAKTLQKVGKATGGEATPTAGKVPALALPGDTGVPAEVGPVPSGAPTKLAAASEPPPIEPPTATGTASNVLSKLIGTPKAVTSAATKSVAGRTVAPILAKPGATVGAAVKQLAGRGVGNALLAQPPQNQPSQDVSSLADQANQSAEQSASDQQTQYPQENMLYDIERDPTHASTYEALYKLMNPSNKPTVAAQNAVLSAENTQSQINAYQTALSGAGGSKGGILGSLTKLAGESKLINTPQAGSAATVNQARNDLGAQLAKLVTGGSRPPEAVTQHYTDLVPTTTDTSQAAKAKFAYIESLVNDMKSNAQGNNSSSSTADLTDALSALGAQ